MPKTASLHPSRTAVAGPMASLAGLLRDWLPRQRWFAGKDRPVTDLALLSMTELYPGCLHLLVHAGPRPCPPPAAPVPRRPVTATSCSSVCAGICRRVSAGP